MDSHPCSKEPAAPLHFPSSTHPLVQAGSLRGAYVYLGGKEGSVSPPHQGSEALGAFHVPSGQAHLIVRMSY